MNLKKIRNITKCFSLVHMCRQNGRTRKGDVYCDKQIGETEK